MKKTIIFVFLFTITLAGCAGNQTQVLPNAEHITALSNDCEEIYTRQVETWAIASQAENPTLLDQVYTEDIVHYDGYPVYVGLDSVTKMADRMFRQINGWEMAAGDVYISEEKCVGAWINWGIFGFTKEDPGTEFDLIEMRDDKISFWRLFYDEKFQEEFDNSIDMSFLETYAETWSEGDKIKIKNLYAKNAIFEDTLFGAKVEGRGNISKEIGQILVRGANHWDVLTPYEEGEAPYPYNEEIPYPSKGGVFGITVLAPNGNSCEVIAFLILTPDEDGLIVKQETFYSADSLLECGWAE